MRPHHQMQVLADVHSADVFWLNCREKALKKLELSGHRRPHLGFSLMEVMAVMAVSTLLVAFSVPSFLRAAQHTQQVKAAQTMKDIHAAQEAHRIIYGSYAATYRELGSGSPLPAQDQGKIGSGTPGEDVMVFQGYIFRLRRTAPDAYTVEAEPIPGSGRTARWKIDQLSTLASSKQLAAPGIGPQSTQQFRAAREDRKRNTNGVHPPNIESANFESDAATSKTGSLPWLGN